MSPSTNNALQLRNAISLMPMEDEASGAEVALLIHGLGGTTTDLGSLKRKLANDRLHAFDLMLPGHGGEPHDLTKVRAESWLAAINEKIAELRRDYETVHLVGLCMGALLALEAAKKGLLGLTERDRLVLLAPPVFLDGWSLPWYRSLRFLVYASPMLAGAMKFSEAPPFGVKNKRMRRIVEDVLQRKNSLHYAWVPLIAIRELDKLRKMAQRNLERVTCPTLIIHSLDDELTSIRSATFLRDGINGNRDNAKAHIRVLSDSYHMVCIDNERDDVVRHVRAFLAS